MTLHVDSFREEDETLFRTAPHLMHSLHLTPSSSTHVSLVRGGHSHHDNISTGILEMFWNSDFILQLIFNLKELNTGDKQKNMFLNLFDDFNHL